MPRDPHPHLPGQTQRVRRVKYGLNVAAAVTLAVLIAVLVNWMGYRQFVRFDFTATRQYSLSPQTLKLLESLDGDYRLVTLFSRGGPYVDQATDLLDEYGRYGRHVTVEHIDPGRELGRMDQFLTALRDGYESELEPLDQAIRAGRDEMQRVRQSSQRVLEPLGRVLKDPALGDGELKRFVQSVAQAFARFDGDIDAVDQQIKSSLDRALPRFGAAKSTIQKLLDEVDTKILTLSIDRFNQAVQEDETPASVANQLLATVVLLEQSRQKIRDAVSALRAARRVQEYDKLVEQLDNPETLVLVGPGQVRVISLGELFRQPDPSQIQPGQEPQLRFQGEEKITGALVSMSLDQPPLVVFVVSGQNQAIGQRGLFQQVAARLGHVNFQVQQWSPTPQPGPMGQPMPPQPAPQPASGQKAVWVVLPLEPPNPMNPMGGASGQQIADFLKGRINAGDAVLIMLTVSPMARFGEADPISRLLSPWGITPQIDRLVLHQIDLPDRQKQADNRIFINDWPSELPITQALIGMPGIFVQASPLVLGKGDGQGVETWPLVQVQGDDYWSQRDLHIVKDPKLDPATAGGPFVIAAAAQRQGQRIVVVGDPAWATDQITNLGRMGLPIEIAGAQFPANSEFFVNSVYWLAGLDQLIAASARTQDIRRIHVTDAAGVTLRWALLAGMPLVTVLLGVGVWARRRRD